MAQSQTPTGTAECSKFIEKWNNVIVVSEVDLGKAFIASGTKFDKKNQYILFY